jgi:phospholipid/cholesterol/gamma-HCH transport system permease protein
MRYIKQFFYNLGKYVVFLGRVVAKPEKAKPYYSQIVREFSKLGLDSLGLVIIVSLFMGAVITLQAALNFTNPLLPKSFIGYGARDSIILEFSSSMVSLILAGKIGANIASELGTMRISQQIDALEIMGVNSAGYLVLPKLIAAVLFFPVFGIVSMATGIFGGWLVAYFTDIVNISVYEQGLRLFFNPYYITYSLTKITVFGFIISSISSYQGYFVEGGSVEVGKASTKAVVYSSIAILLFNVILTKILL